MKKFTPDHEWIHVENGVGTVGITDYAQEALGDIVFVDLPTVGARFSVGDEAAVVESVKSTGDVKNPVAGEIVAVNGTLTDNPALVNSAAEGDGWIYKIKIDDPSQLDALLDADGYQKTLGH